MCCWYEWLYSLAVLTVMTAAVPFSAVDSPVVHTIGVRLS